MKPQAAAVLGALRSQRADGLTPDQARRWLHCDRLAARVKELRDAGYPITTHYQTSDAGARYARYTLALPDRPAPLTGTQMGLLA